LRERLREPPRLGVALGDLGDLGDLDRCLGENFPIAWRSSFAAAMLAADGLNFLVVCPYAI